MAAWKRTRSTEKEDSSRAWSGTIRGEAECVNVIASRYRLKAHVLSFAWLYYTAV
jgi:hypothetical protein